MRIVFGLFLLLLSSNAVATQYCVDEANGSEGNTGLYPNECFVVSQTAVTVAGDGDSICWEPGAYSGFRVDTSNQTYERCPGAAVGSVTVDGSITTTKASIYVNAGVTGGVIDGLDFSFDLYASGQYGLFMGASNHSWQIRNMGYNRAEDISLYKSGADNYQWVGGRGEITALCPFASECRTQLWHLRGDDIVFENNFGRYWSFQFVGEDKSTRRLVVQHNDFAHSSHHIIAVDSDCSGSADWMTGNVYYENYFGQSWISDGWQINSDASAPAGTKDQGTNNPVPLPCKGGYHITRNIMYGNGEQAIDTKGLKESVIEHNLLLGNPSDNDGPSDGYDPTCSGAITIGSDSWEHNRIVRGNVTFNNPRSSTGTDGGDPVYGNVGINDFRGNFSGDDVCNVSSGSYGFGGIKYSWAGPTVIANNIFVGGLLNAVDVNQGRSTSASDPAIIDYNQYGIGANRWVWNSGTERASFTDWKSDLAADSTVEGNDANGTDGVALDDVLIDQTMEGVEFGYGPTDDSFTPITKTAVDAMISRLALKTVLQTGGGHIAEVRANSTGATIDVGAQANAFCCRWNLPSNSPVDKDTIRINGSTDRQVVSVDIANNTITVDSAVSVTAGDTIDIVYPSGRTSLQVGAHEYWTGTVVTPPPTQTALKSVGLRFQNVNLPALSTTSSVTLKLTATDAKSAATTWTLYGDLSIASAAFTATDFNISDRTLTANTASCSTGSWVADTQYTLSCTGLDGILDELNQQSGWTSSSPVTLVLTGTGERIFYAYDGDPAKAANLDFSYVSAGTPPVWNPQSQLFWVEANASTVTVCATEASGTPTLTADLSELVTDTPTFTDLTTGCGTLDWTPQIGDYVSSPYAVTFTATGETSGLTSDLLVFINVSESAGGLVEIPVITSLDDVEELLAGGVPPEGTVYDTSSWYDLMYDQGPNALAHQVNGLRFQGVQVAQGDTISTAWVEFTSRGTQSNPVNISIAGEAIDDAPAFTTTLFDVTNRTRTSALANWSPGAWVTGTKYQTVDISQIIQEIVNRAGWTAGNDIVIFLWGDGVDTDKRVADTFDSNPALAAKLHIEFSSTVTPPTGLTYTITAETEDGAEQLPAGTTVASADTMAIGGKSVVGLIFDNVALTRNQVLNAAWLSIDAAATESTAANIIIEGMNTSAPALINPAVTYDISTRARTSRHAFWIPGNWTADTTYQSPDIANIISKIISRSDWDSGDDIGLTLSSTAVRTLKACGSVTCTDTVTLHIDPQ